jgi:ABC-type Fe3+/spermidine/putrescine transport system ATPase subunit
LAEISKSFGGVPVIKNLSLSIRQAELCCLLGPSGCGKTTVLKIIDGLLEADRGRVFLFGEDITGLPPQKRRLGMVFQNYALFPQMNIFENIAYGLKRRKVSRDVIKTKVSASLNLVRLQGIEDRRIHELSGGQQQRVALARALVIEPQALLLDEPLSNLDAKLRAGMREEIKHLQQQLGIATVYVTHDQEEAMSIADRIVVMNNGVIEQVGTPREVYERPVTRFVADFIGHCNFINGEVADGCLVVLGKRFDGIAGEYPPGTGVTCGIRPERVRLSLPGGGDFTGKIVETTYLGSTVTYRLSLVGTDAYQELTAELPVSAASFRMGDIVDVGFLLEDIRIFTE